MRVRTDRRTMDRLGKKSIYSFFLKKKAGIINRFDISVYGLDASTDRTFLHSKIPKSFLLQTILLFHMLTLSCHPLVSHT